jgi:GNAT superfamily N-acetyltransferase
MNIRHINADELPQLLELYTHLHPDVPEIDYSDEAVQSLWRNIMEQPHLRYMVAEKDRRIVSTCSLAIILNLTYDLRPYGVVQNVVTDPQYRKKGIGTRVLQAALEEAWGAGCYKVILETGNKSRDIVRFYHNAGFKSGIKTGFVAYPEGEEI